MNRKGNILFIVNEANINKSTLLPVIDYAKKFEAHIHFLRIYPSYKSISEFFGSSIDQTKNTLLSNLEEEIKKSESHLSEMDYSCYVRDGVWFIESILESARLNADILVISDPEDNINGFASNAMHLVRKSPIPVWWLRKNTSSHNTKILIAVDSDINNKAKRNTNERCMEIAKRLAESSRLPSEIYIIHCWFLFNEYYLRECASNISQSRIDEMAEREKQFHQEWFDSFCARYNDTKLAGTYFLKGEPEEAVPAMARILNADLMIMASVNDIHTPGLYITSRAESIIQKVSCSLLTIKPDGFVSPVK